MHVLIREDLAHFGQKAIQQLVSMRIGGSSMNASVGGHNKISTTTSERGGIVREIVGYVKSKIVDVVGIARTGGHYFRIAIAEPVQHTKTVILNEIHRPLDRGAFYPAAWPGTSNSDGGDQAHKIEISLLALSAKRLRNETISPYREGRELREASHAAQCHAPRCGYKLLVASRHPCSQQIS